MFWSVLSPCCVFEAGKTVNFVTITDRSVCVMKTHCIILSAYNQL